MPLKLPFRPKPARLPRKVVPMTIAAGLVCSTGVVVTADTQATISGYVKEYQGKVKTILLRDGWSLAITGSGPSDYIEAAYQRIFEDPPAPQHMRQIEEFLRVRGQDFFDSHIARWAYFPENDRPSVELLIGVAGGKKHALFHYTGTALNRVIEAKAVGAGILLANNLIAQHHSYNHSLEKTASIAVYILSKVKRQVDTCGGGTDLIVLESSGNIAFTQNSEIETLERKYADIEKTMNATLSDEIGRDGVGFQWLRGPRGQSRRLK